jgi:hypothetical protein
VPEGKSINSRKTQAEIILQKYIAAISDTIIPKVTVCFQIYPNCPFILNCGPLKEQLDSGSRFSRIYLTQLRYESMLLFLYLAHPGMYLCRRNQLNKIEAEYDTSWEKQSRTEEILSLVFVYLNVLYDILQNIDIILFKMIDIFCKWQRYSWDSRALCQRLWVMLWDVSMYSLVEIKNSQRSAVCLRLTGFLLGLLFNLAYGNNISLRKKKLHGLSPRANYTDRVTAACRRSDCQLLRIEGAT